MQKGNKKLINAWAFYDWANSSYALVISTAVFPIYYNAVTTENGSDKVSFFGFEWVNSALYSYTLSFSFLLVACLSPILSAIADYTGNKLNFMKFFCYLGAFSCSGLYFFTGKENLWLGILLTITASIGFWGSIVFYNAYLPEIAYRKQQDQVSAKGFAYGYAGSTILMLFILTMISLPHLYGISSDSLPPRIAFLTVGLWWIVFAQITFHRLPNNVYGVKPDKDFIFKGYRELRIVFGELRTSTFLKRFLAAFFFYSLGAQTIFYVAGLFGDKELGLATEKLIGTILVLQIVGIAGAYLFSYLSGKMGNINALKLVVFIWIIGCSSAYFLDKNDPDVEYKFYALGSLVGLVMGAIQALSRSTYSKMLSEKTIDHATYFSFYDVTEKVAIVLGTFVYGLMETLTGSMKTSILALSAFFILGFMSLSFIKESKHND